MRQALQTLRRSQHRAVQFLRFSLVGLATSVVDAGLLYLLSYRLGMDWQAARLLSLTAALLGSYVLNGRYTFGDAGSSPSLGRLAGHCSVNGCGAALNFGLFSVVVEQAAPYWNAALPAAALPLFALWLGGMAGMTFNFMLSSRFVFRSAQGGAQGLHAR